MFTRFSLKAKLLSLCLGLCALSLVVGSIGYVSLQDVQSEYAFLPNKVMPKLEHLNNMFLDYRKVRITLRTLGMKGLTPEAATQTIKEAEHAIEEYEAANKHYTELGFVPGQKELYEKVELAWQDFKKTGGDVISLYNSGTPESLEKVTQIFFQDCPAKAKVYTEAVQTLEDFHKTVGAEKVKSAELVAQRAQLTTMATIGIGVLLGLICGVFFATALAKSLDRISTEISMASEQTAAGGSQLAAASSQLSGGSAESAASLQQTVASLEELSSMVKNNSDHAVQANRLSHSSRDTAEKGMDEMTKVISAMDEISSSSKKMEDIINVIDDIAFQTNLLALNAAVEAARAGDQGKGFSVVAEAVRSLAQRSALAAKDISSLIKENVTKSGYGAEVANASGAALKEILETIKKVADLNTEISHGSQEQTTGIQQISQAMNQLDQATQGNASSAEEVAASSEEMSSQAKALSDLVVDLQVLVAGAGQAKEPKPHQFKKSA
jgi:methyl-accepting chemotaxis protein